MDDGVAAIEGGLGGERPYTRPQRLQPGALQAQQSVGHVHPALDQTQDIFGVTVDHGEGHCEHRSLPHHVEALALAVDEVSHPLGEPGACVGQP